jgi:leucine dehydrogenase
MKVYGTSAETLEDAMRLSAAMTRKLAVAGLPFGGGKAVIRGSGDPKRGEATRSFSPVRRSRRVAGWHLSDELGHEHG